MSAEKFSPVDRPEPTGFRRKAALFLATGAGFGFSPVASGTVGTLWGVALVWGLHQFTGSLWWHGLVAVGLSLLAIPICHDAEAVFKRKDDGRIVADEYMTFPLCMLGLPASPVMLLVAFLTNRFFDILKFPPARQLQRVPGGAGIVIDDVAAAIYSLIVNWAVYLALSRFAPITGLQ